jgi:D-tyrosyl-tRNA(Tyr) deacylase
MRAVVQRVTEARVHVGAHKIGEIGHGLLVLVAIGRDDGPDDVQYVTGKVRDARLFDGEGGQHLHRSVLDIEGSVLVVSQFTLYGDIRKGRRPSFDAAASPTHARAIYLDLVRELRRARLPVATGEFQATMRVELVNDGPVTILIDSARQF